MSKNSATNDQILFNQEASKFLNKVVADRLLTDSSIFLLIDENTERHCLPHLLNGNAELSNCQLLRINSGERNKNLTECQRLWTEMLKSDAGRNSLFINLGGGVICDLGGFVASCFKRGIDFIHIPTTLLAQVDASIGGKVGVNLNHAKNQVGMFSLPLSTLVFPKYLETLDNRHMLNGFAEVMKHALLFDASFFDQISQLNPEKFQDSSLIKKAASFKQNIVEQDRTEMNKRKLLNFGHTFGHAIESLSLEYDNDPLLHGEAIAAGMICEIMVSCDVLGFDSNESKDVISRITSWYPCRKIDSNLYDRLWDYLKKDKKMQGGKINMIGLNQIGDAVSEVELTKKMFHQALEQYNNLANF